MSFLRPEYLWALTALIIPIILHFINFRRPEKLAFSTLTFFEELQKTTVRKLKLKQLLLLALRMLALAALVFALAGPVIYLDNSSSDIPDRYVFVIDNSTSMNRIDADGPLIDQAKTTAMQIIEQAPDDARFIVLATHGKQIPIQFRDKNPSLALIKDIRPRSAASSIEQSVRALTSDLRFRNTDMRWYWLGDQQKTYYYNVAEDLGKNDPSPWNLTYIDVSGESNQNAGISNLALGNQIVAMGRPAQIGISVKNYGDQPLANYFLTLHVNGSLAGQQNISLKGDEEMTANFEISVNKPGYHRLKVTLKGDPVEYDNTRFATLHVPEEQRVAVLSDPDASNSEQQAYTEAFIEASKRVTSDLKLTTFTLDELQRTDLNDFDAVLLHNVAAIPGYLNELLLNYVEQGNGLMLIPSENMNLNSWNTLLQELRLGRITSFSGDYGNFEPIARVATPDTKHPVYRGMFDQNADKQIQIESPDIFYMADLDLTSAGFNTPVLSTDIGKPVLTESRVGDGRVIIFSIGLEPAWSNLPANALFAPLIYRSLYYSASSGQSELLSQSLESPFTFTANFDTEDISIEATDGQQFRPSVQSLTNLKKVVYNGFDLSPGFIMISGKNIVHQSALNLPVYESETDKISADSLESKLGELFNSVVQIDESGNLSSDESTQTIFARGFGHNIWYYFIILGIIVLFSEQLVQRYYAKQKP